MRPSNLSSCAALSIFLLFGGCTRPSAEESGRHGEAHAATDRARYGALMADIGRRFELVGRAGAAGRVAFAQYQVDELREQFEDALALAEPPRKGADALPAREKAFADRSLTDLRVALATGDGEALRGAFERAANACNDCHRATRHGFIVVPVVPGRSVPELGEHLEHAARSAGSRP